jgi:hypothetical protein
MRPVIVAFFAATIALTANADNLGIPFNDLGPRPYRLGYFGGLYENGSNEYPPDHLAAGLEISRNIQPLDADGNPSPDGKIGLITIGNGDTDRVICSPFRTGDCWSGSFTEMIRDNPRVNPSVVVVNAAHEDFTAREIDPILDNLQRYVLEPAGISERQVQVAWLQMSKDHPFVDITCACADDYNLKIDMGITLRALKARYPNLQTAYLSSRPFAGYSADAWNTEPFAYDTAIMMRIMIWDQLEQVRTGTVFNDSRVGQINYTKGQAPWIAWGPYMWANGETPRSDGLTWLPEDYDGPLLSEKGASKAAGLLFDFFMSDPTTRMWFAAPGLTRGRAVRH